MAHKVVRGRLEARDWALSRDLAFSLSARLSPENFGIGSFCVSQQVAVECQVKLRPHPPTPSTPNPSSLPTWYWVPRTDPSRVAVDLSTSSTYISINCSDGVCSFCMIHTYIRRRVASLTPVAIWRQGVGLIPAGWHCAVVTDKKAAACGDTTGPVSLFSTAALFIALCPVPFDFPSSFHRS